MHLGKEINKENRCQGVNIFQKKIYSKRINDLFKVIQLLSSRIKS